jgi:hypothetical protein
LLEQSVLESRHHQLELVFGRAGQLDRFQPAERGVGDVGTPADLQSGNQGIGDGGTGTVEYLCSGGKMSR